MAYTHTLTHTLSRGFIFGEKDDEFPNIKKFASFPSINAKWGLLINRFWMMKIHTVKEATHTHMHIHMK